MKAGRGRNAGDDPAKTEKRKGKELRKAHHVSFKVIVKIGLLSGAECGFKTPQYFVSFNEASF